MLNLYISMIWPHLTILDSQRLRNMRIEHTIPYVWSLWRNKETVIFDNSGNAVAINPSIVLYNMVVIVLYNLVVVADLVLSEMRS